MIRTLFYVMAGSAIGGLGRFGLDVIIKKHLATTFPWSTLFINLLGSFLIGVFYSMAEQHKIMSSDLRIFLMTGICGGFTTFSAFSLENYNLLEQGLTGCSLMYITLSIILGIACIYGGILTVRLFA
jgi:CrcB protein